MITTITRFAFFALSFLPLAISAKTIYVNGSYTGTEENGISWETPYKGISEAIDAADAGDELWVAKGIYFAPAGPLSQGWHIIKDISIIGGFSGDETSVSTRDFEEYKTIFKGNYSQSSNP